MKRKLFSAILFGALLTASTSGLTSCKDYDDDISNLQSQIDKLATADQLSAKVSEMQAAISAAQSAAEAKAAAAQTVADAAKSAAADAAAAASKAQSTADAASKDAAAAAAAAAEVQKAADKAIAELEAKAATKDELKAAADAAEAAVKAIQAAHAADKAAIEKAIADGLAEVKAEIAKTNEELGKLADRLKVVEDKLAAIEAGEGQEEALKAIQEEVEDIADALEDIIGEYTSMVTAVDLYASTALTPVPNALNDPFALDFVYVAQEKNAVFPAEEGVADAQIEFSDKNKNVTTTDSLVIRVSPTNAVLNPANISLINSQGKELSEYVEVEKVEPYAELLTKSAEGNGLWNVVFKVKEGIDREKFTEAVMVNKKSVLFAVAVKNTESNDVRRVVSSYDVTAVPSTYEPARAAFQATDRDGKWFDVSEMHNRFKYVDDKTYYATSMFENSNEAGKQVKGTPEYRWNDEPQVEGTTAEYKLDNNDSRGDIATSLSKKIIEVAVGQPIELSVATFLNASRLPEFDHNGKGSVVTGYKDNAGDYIKGFYVTLDTKFAVESSPSELRAWESYSYTNVGVPGTSAKAKLFYGNTGSISVDSEGAFGDVIGFRVYAVNLDGTLVDPDGRAFYVRVGSLKKTAALAVADFEAVLNYDKNKNTYHFNGNNYFSAPVALSDEVKAIAGDVVMANSTFEITVNPATYGNNTVEPEYSTTTKDYLVELVDTNNDQVLDAARVVIKDPTKFLDDATYTAAGSLKDASGMTLCDVTFKFKKTLPTVAPDLAWNSSFTGEQQIIANAAPNAANIYSLAAGSIPQAVELPTLMTNLFYGNGATEAGWYTLNFKGVQKGWKDAAQTKPEYTDIQVPTNAPNDYAALKSAYKLENLDKTAVDGKAHSIEYTYNFGKISLKKNYALGNNFKEDYCKVPGKALSMTFNSWIDFEQIAWKTGKKPEVKWVPGSTTAGKTIELTTYSGGNAGTNSEVETGFAVNKTTITSANAATYTYNTTGSKLPTTADGIIAYMKSTNGKYYLVDLSASLTSGGTDKFVVKAIGTDGVTPVNDYFVNGTVTQTKIDKGQLIEFKTNVPGTKYIKYSIASGTGAGDYIIVPGKGATCATMLSDGFWYKMLWDAATKSFKFVNSQGTVIPDQTPANIMGTNGSGVKLSSLDNLVKEIQFTNTGSSQAGSSSIVNCWNTVVAKYNTAGNAILGAAGGKEVEIHSLINTYMTVVDIKANDSDPYKVDSWDVTSNNKTVKIVQKAGQAIPSVTEGTLIFTLEDCFGHKVNRELKYTIKVN